MTRVDYKAPGQLPWAAHQRQEEGWGARWQRERAQPHHNRNHNHNHNDNGAQPQPQPRPQPQPQRQPQQHHGLPAAMAVASSSGSGQLQWPACWTGSAQQQWQWSAAVVKAAIGLEPTVAQVVRGWPCEERRFGDCGWQLQPKGAIKICGWGEFQKPGCHICARPVLAYLPAEQRVEYLKFFRLHVRVRLDPGGKTGTFRE